MSGPGEPSGADAARGAAPRILLIPAFDEEASLPRVLAAARAAAPDYEIVVVDDGSRDATSAVAAAAGARVLRHAVNLGYGAAVQTGYKYALARGAAVVVQLDADGQHDPADVATLAEPVLRGDLDLVVGSRFLAPTGYPMGAARSLGRRLFSAVARAFGLRLSDPTSGFQALSPRMLALYAADTFPSDYPDVDVLIAAHRRGARIGERSVRMRPATRPSLLHSRLTPFYYVYRTLLAVWAATSRRP